MKKLLYLYIVLLFISCGTTIKTIEVPVETIKKEYIHDIKIDSIYITDSVDRFIKGDTFYLTKKHIEYKYIIRVDTIQKADTIPKVITKTIEKEVKVNHIYWWQKLLMYMGILLIGIVIIKIKFK